MDKNNITTEKTKLCIECKTPITGRRDKIYCDAYCKSSYQYKTHKKESKSIHRKVTNQLKKNKNILKKFNTKGKTIVEGKDMLEAGFNPRIFTHYWQNPRGDYYLFVYEYGFLQLIRQGRIKYLLIVWQGYMNKQIEIKPPSNTASISSKEKK